MRSIHRSLFHRRDPCIPSAASTRLYLCLTAFARQSGYNSIVNGFRTARRVSLLGFAFTCLAFAASPATYQLPARSSGAPGWVLADLDGDRIADMAAAGPGLRDGRGYIHQVNIDLTGSQSTSFTVRGDSPSIRLTFRDIDGDHDRDLIVFEPSSVMPIGVWLNDGAGHFTEGKVADYLSRLGTPDTRSFAGHRTTKEAFASLHDDRTPSGFYSTTAYSHFDSAGDVAAGTLLVITRILPGGFGPRGPPCSL